MQAFEETMEWVRQPMIDHSVDCHNCKVAMVSTCCSRRPICPFVFRSYQHPPGTRLVFEGACRHSWLEALRATSAAPYFFEGFACGGERFQDGAIAANNPVIIALHEARLLWPGTGSGSARAPAANASEPSWWVAQTQVSTWWYPWGLESRLPLEERPRTGV